jgi:hypothetical protein
MKQMEELKFRRQQTIDNYIGACRTYDDLLRKMGWRTTCGRKREGPSVLGPPEAGKGGESYPLSNTLDFEKYA